MKERPILFSGPMVRGILEDRKTQTRRVIMPQPSSAIAQPKVGQYFQKPCPYGAPGDRLWVRETFCLENNWPDPEEFPPPMDGRPIRWHDCPDDDSFAIYPRYRATEPLVTLSCEHEGCEGEPCRHPWKPSIFMPRWASRITLEITEVRVQRVQEIAEDDARAEGCQPQIVERAVQCGTRKTSFHDLWDSINAKRRFGWATNPWVWAITFRRLP